MAYIARNNSGARIRQQRRNAGGSSGIENKAVASVKQRNKRSDNKRVAAMLVSNI